MKSIIKKSSIQALSVFLSFLMIFYLIPASVFAMDNSEDNTSKASNEAYITEEESVFELEDLREESVKHFRLDDGSIMAVQYGNAVHRADESGVWQDIDNRLFMGLNDISTFDARVKFAKKTTGNETLFTLHDGNMKIALSLNGANKKVYGQVTNHSDDTDATQLQKMMNLEKLSANILYANILDGVDLEYIVQSNNIKENIIVKEHADEYVYNFTLKLNNLTASMDASGQILLADSDSNICYTIPAGVMIDADGEASRAVAYTLTDLGNGSYTLTITADAAWINADGRVFPVTIDPPIYANYDSPVTEVVVNKSSQNYNMQNAELFAGGGYRSYWKLDTLPNIPTSAKVVNATFSDVALRYSPATVCVHNVLTDWSDDLTWAKISAASDAQGVMDTNIVDYNKDFVTYKRYTWNITPIVDQWYAGSNYGLALEGIVESSIDYAAFGSSGWDYGYVSILCINYVDMVGLEDYWTYTSQSAGFAGSGAVNLATGQLTFTIPTLSSLDALMPITPTLVYNSGWAGKEYTASNMQVPYLSSATPLGFKLNLQESLVLRANPTTDDASADMYVWSDSDGTEHYFLPTDETGVYKDDSGLLLTLTEEGNARKITDSNHSVRTFARIGSTYGWYLQGLTDQNGNHVVFDVNSSYHPTAVTLYPNNIAVGIEQLKIGYNTDGQINIVYNPHSNEAVVLAYSNGYLCTLTRAHGTDSVTWDAWQTYAASQSATTGITVDATAQYVYSSGKLVNVRNNLTQYELYYTHPFGRVMRVSEHAGAVGSQTVGQSVSISYTATSASVRTSGTDDTIGTTDDLLTTYVFDSYGRAVNAYTTDINGTQLYGASSSAYVSDNENAKNSLKTVVQTQESSGNYLLNGGFEIQGNPIPYWTATASDGTTFGTTYDNVYASHGEACVQMGVGVGYTTSRSISQTVALPAGAYTLSFSYQTRNVNGAMVRMSVDSAIDTQDTSKELALNNSDMPVPNQQASLQFTVTPTSDSEYVVCTVKIELILTDTTAGAASMYLDDVMLAKTTGVLPYNMVQFGHFENASQQAAPLSKWTASDSASIVDSASAFGNVLQLSSALWTPASATQTVYQASESLKNSYLYGGMSLAEDMYFTVSAWGKGTQQVWNENAKFALRIDIWYYDTRDVVAADPIYIDFNRDVTDWQFISAGFITDAQEGLLDHIDVTLVYDGHPGTAWFDNISVVQDNGDTAFYTYNNNGYVNDYREGLYQYWYMYDAQGNVQKMISNMKYYVEYVYDNCNRLTEEKYFNYTDATITESESGITIAFPTTGDNAPLLKNRTKYNYNRYGLLESTYWYEKDATIRTAYTMTDYNLSATDPHFGSIRLYFNTEGYITRYFYDENTARLIAVIYPDETGLYYRYDAIGNLVEVMPAEQVIIAEATGEDQYSYAPVMSDTNIDYTYDSTNRLSTIATASTTYTFVYDVWGNTTGVSVGNSTLATYTYNDRNGKLNTMTYGNGFSVQYKYDALDRISEIWHNTGEDNAYEKVYAYFYDYAGRLTMVEDFTEGGKNIVNEYDAAGRLRQTYTYDATDNTTENSVRLQYDEQERLQQTNYRMPYTYASGTTFDTFSYFYDYNLDSQLSQVQVEIGNLDGTIGLSYNKIDWLMGKTLEYELDNEAVYYSNISYTYKDRSTAGIKTPQITQMTIQRGLAAGASSYDTTTYQFTYDVNGNITHIYDGEGNLLNQYTYDDLGQLVYERFVLMGMTLEYSYTYDAAGNSTARLVNNASTVQSTYAGDRLLSYGGLVATYDALGNMTQLGSSTEGTQFTWQGRQMTSSCSYYTSSTGTTQYTNMAYTYNADGIRTSKTIGSIKHEYILAGSQIVAEVWVEGGIEYMLVFLYDEAGSPVGFLYRTSEYAKKDYDAYFYEKNIFGDIVAVYSETGQCVAEYTYTAWGYCFPELDVGGIGTLNPIRYRGYYYDEETSLYYLQSRYYNPLIGRFISPDCYVSTGTGLLGYNMYLYCNNNPVMYVDPSGETLGFAIACLFVAVAACASPFLFEHCPGYSTAPKAQNKEEIDEYVTNEVEIQCVYKEGCAPTVQINIPLDKLRIPDMFEDYFIDLLYNKMLAVAWEASPNSIDHFNLMSREHIQWEYEVHLWGYESGVTIFKIPCKDATLNYGETYWTMTQRAFEYLLQYLGGQ